MTQRELQAELNPAAYERLSEALQLKRPVTVEFLSEQLLKDGWETHADYLRGAREIRLFLKTSNLQTSQLREVRTRIAFVLLHEFRHAYQDDHWDAAKLVKDAQLPYGMQKQECDANEWAAENVANFRDLVKLRIHTPKPYDHGRGARGFSRLSEVTK